MSLITSPNRKWKSSAKSPITACTGGFVVQHVCFHTMLILSLREQSSQNQSQYDQHHQYNAYPGVPTASSRESRRRVLRFNKVNILSCLFLAPPALWGRDGDIFPASHFSWLPKQDGLVGDSSADASKGLEMQRCRTRPETMSTLCQREQSAQQKVKRPKHVPAQRNNSRGLKTLVALEFHPSRGPSNARCSKTEETTQSGDGRRPDETTRRRKRKWSLPFVF